MIQGAAQKQTVVLVKGMSQYGALTLHIDQLEDVFLGMGYRVLVLDFGGDEWRPVLAEAAKDDVLMIFSISIFTEIRFDGLTLAEILDAPHVCLQVDHPGWHLPRLQKSPRQSTIFLTLDHAHTRFINRCFVKDPFPVVEFLPPAANVLPENAPVDVASFAEDRDIPILFTGTYRGKIKPEWNRLEGDAGQMFKDIYNAALEVAVSDDLVSADDALYFVMREGGIDSSFPLFSDLITKSFWLSSYLHGMRRDLVLQALNEAGLPVHIYGHGFDKLAGQFKSFTYGGVGSFSETLGLIRRSQFVLNSNTNFVEGMHERVFAAMAGGAAVVSDLSKAYLDEFQDGVDMVLYSWDDLPGLGDRLRAYLDRPHELAQIAAAGQTKVLARHMWQNRAQRMIQLAQDYQHPYSAAA